jgi:DNA-binding GntR family transcriptional regulator
MAVALSATLLHSGYSTILPIPFGSHAAGNPSSGLAVKPPKTAPMSNNAAAPPRAFDAKGRKQIVRGNLHDEVATVLRDMIMQDELPPGTRIPENDLCAQLGISRTPLREAIRVLASEGLVKPLPRRGAIVATPDPDEIQGLFYAIGAIESFSARLACINLTSAEIDGILKLHNRLVQLHTNDKGNKEYFRVNLAIHQAIVRGAGNKFLAELHESLSVRILRARFFVNMPQAAWNRAIKEHEQIAVAIRKRDAPRLSELLVQHMAGSWRDYDLTLNRSGFAQSFMNR